MKRIVFGFVLFAGLLSAQINIGVKNDHFISTNAITENPSVFLQNPHPWEINLISADVFLNNNYAFISKKNLLAIPGTDISINDESNQDNLPKGNIGFQDKNKFNYHYQTDVLGPSFAVKFKIKDQEFAMGYIPRLRVFGNSFNVENQYKYPNYINQESYTRYFQPISLRHATILENNFFISKALYQDKTSEFLAGVTIKKSQVLDAIFIKENDVYSIDYDLTSDSLTISDYNAEVFLTTSYDFDQKKYKPKNMGSSIGGDIGFTYVDYGGYEKEDGEYFQKIGFSITDIGFIKLKGEKHLFKGNPYTFDRNLKLKNGDNPYNLLDELSFNIYGNSNQSLVGNTIDVALPTALHASYSGNLLKNRYITLGFTQRIPLSKNAFKVPNFFFVNLSKSKQSFTYAAQFSMYEYRSPQFGGYFRWGPLFIGSDNILPIFFRQKKLDSFDFYFGLKLYPFWDNAFKKHRRQDCDCIK